MDAKEALLAELLGDVGKLHDRIDEVKTEIEEALLPLAKLNEELRANIAQMRDEQSAAKEVHEQYMGTLALAAKDDLRVFFKQQVTEASNQFLIASKATVKSAIDDLSAAVEREVTGGMSKVADANQVFAENGRRFKEEVAASVAAVRKAGARYESALADQVAKNAPMGFWTQLLVMALTAASASILTAVIMMYGFAPGTDIQQESARQTPIHKKKN